ncbi:MAG: hypothetical protein IIC83_07980 [Chloroflexi bacterium]|nr:hypothetical protein [Chloroflexota bacterium]
MASESERTVELDWDDPIDAIEKAFDLGWSDGLPVVPPTVERVDQFIGLSQRGPNEILGEVPERRREVNVRTAAANAVMAGCLPEHFPVVLAAVEAMLEPEFNLVGPSSSLGGAAILTIVNGPITRELNINSRNNLFGPGNRANATIGRAVRLVLMNACAAIPGLFDRSVLGHPGKYTYCIAEAETETHWTPLHVERGFSASQSTVTVFACEGPRQVRTMGGPENIVFTVADVASSLGTSMSTVGSTSDDSAVVRQGEIAIVVSGQSNVWDGWSKDDFKRALLPRLKRSMADLKRAGEVREELSPGDEETYLQLVAGIEDIIVVFAGGEERTTCAVIPSWGPRVSSSSVSKAIRVP